jgi:quercetin dioxygenase-like cupin family protein
MREMKVETDMQKKSLTALVRHHLNHARDASSGRSAETVYGGHAHVLRQTLIALCAGQRLKEHDNLAEATVQVVEGRVVLTSGGTSWSGWRGDLITMPPGRNSLEAVEDAVILLTVAKLIAPAAS